MQLVTTVAALITSLLFAATVAAQSDQTVVDGQVVQVLDAATLDIDVDNTIERVHLLGISDGDPPAQATSSACTVPSAALSRTHELVDAQTVRLEVDPAFDQPDQLGRTLGVVWLADQRNLAEVLLSEGLTRAQITDRPYANESAYTAAQSLAVANRRGIWARDVCPALEPPPGLANFVMTIVDKTQIASTAVDVLHAQTTTATNFAPALEQPAWRQGTGYALAELRTAGNLLQTASAPTTIAQPLAQRLALVGSDLASGAAAYGQGLDRQDIALVGASDYQLQLAAASLQPLQQQITAFAATYQLGD